jgi:hypothetical protein
MIWLIIIISIVFLVFYKPEPKTESVIGVDSPIIPASEYQAPVYSDASPVAPSNVSVIQSASINDSVLEVSSPVLPPSVPEKSETVETVQEKEYLVERQLRY